METMGTSNTGHTNITNHRLVNLKKCKYFCWIKFIGTALAQYEKLPHTLPIVLASLINSYMAGWELF